MNSYTIGHDGVMSMMGGPQEVDSPRKPGRDNLRMTIPKSGPLDLSIMFCGIGDARHFYGTLVDLLDLYTKKGKSKLGASSANLHFTLVTICLPLSSVCPH